MRVRSRKKQLGAIAASLTVVAALTVGLIGGTGGAAADPGPATPTATGDSVAVAGSPRPIHIGEPGDGVVAFEALNRATASAVEDLPASVGTVLANLPEDPDSPGGATNPVHGTVTALASIELAAGTAEIGFAEVNGALCLFATGKEYEGAALGSCPSLDDATAGKGYFVIPDLVPGKVRVVGLAPDGASQITADSGSNGSVDQKVAVVSNLYQVDLDPEATELVGLSSSGDVAFRVDAPLDRFAEMTKAK